MRKLRSRVLVLMVLLLVMSGCSKQEVQDPITNEAVQTEANVEAVVTNAYEPVTIIVDNGEESVEVTISEAPQRAVSMSHFTTEMMLALELQDQMVGTAWADGEIMPELKGAYDQVEVLSDRYPSKEVFYAAEPDFVTGWASSTREKNIGPLSELVDNGINAMQLNSINPDATMETVYADFMTLGKVFGSEDKALEVVSKMKSDIADVKAKIGDNNEPVKVFAYDSGTDAPFTVCQGLAKSIIEEAGGVNIFGDIEKSYATVSWEEIIERAPEVIVIVDYTSSDSVEEKIRFLTEESPIKDLEVVKQQKFVVIGLSDLSAGLRNVNAIRTLAEGFYPEEY